MNARGASQQGRDLARRLLEPPHFYRLVPPAHQHHINSQENDQQTESRALAARQEKPNAQSAKNSDRGQETQQNHHLPMWIKQNQSSGGGVRQGGLLIVVTSQDTANTPEARLSSGRLPGSLHRSAVSQLTGKYL